MTEAARKELLQRAATAQNESREERLRRCMVEAEQQNFVQDLRVRYAVWLIAALCTQKDWSFIYPISSLTLAEQLKHGD